MMLHTYNSKELLLGASQENHQNHIFSSSPCKLTTLHSPFTCRVFLGFNTHKSKLQNDPFHYSSQTHQRNSKILHTQKFNKEIRGNLGFKLHGHSKALILPAKSVINGKKKKYGGVLPSVLRSLESEDDIEKALSSYYEKLSPKEQTVILKEQRRWDKVLKVFQWLKSQNNYTHNVIHYNIVLRSLGRAKKWDELRLSWIEMAKNRVLPTNNTYGMLVDVYGKAGLVKESLLWIKHMNTRGLFPDEVTMNTVVRVLKDASEFNRAIKFYKNWCNGKIELDEQDLDSIIDSDFKLSAKHFLLTELFKTGERRNSNSFPDERNLIRKAILSSTYNTLIDLYGKMGNLNEAANIFSEMMKNGVKLDTITFNTMIHICGTHGYISESESLLHEMKNRGILPDIKTYNILISLYFNSGNFHEAIKKYRKLKEVKLLPDEVTYRIVLQKLCEKKMIQEVEDLLLEITKFGKQIDEYSIPYIVKMYVHEGFIEKAKLIYEKRELSSKIRGAILDIYAEKGFWVESEILFFSKKDLNGNKREVNEYNVMIKSYGKAKLYEKAFLLFKSMKNYGIWPDLVTYNSIIQMFSSLNLPDQAKEILIEMRKVGFTPPIQTYSSIISSFAKVKRLTESVNLFNEMLSFGIKGNEIVYGALINGFSEENEFEKAIYYFNLMQENDIKPNLIVLSIMIKCYGKLGSYELVKSTWARVSSMGPDIVAYNSMMSLYGELGMVNEAKVIFDVLVSKKIGNGVSFGIMMYVYKNMGMFNEEFEVAKKMRGFGLVKEVVDFNRVMGCYVMNGELFECGEMLNEMIFKGICLDNGSFRVLFSVLKKGGVPVDSVSEVEGVFWKGERFARDVIVGMVFSVVGMDRLAVEMVERVDRVNSVNTEFETVNSIFETVNPVNSVNPGFETVNPLNPVNPVNPEFETVNPEFETVNSVFETVNPVNSVNPEVTTVNPEFELVNSVNPEFETVNPVNSVNAEIKTVNQEFETVNSLNPETVFETVNPVNSVNPEFEKVNPVNSVKPEFEKVNPVNSANPEFETVNSPNPVFETVNTVNPEFETVNSVHPVNSPKPVFKMVNSVNPEFKTVNSVNLVNPPNPVCETVNPPNPVFETVNSVNLVNSTNPFCVTVNSANSPNPVNSVNPYKTANSVNLYKTANSGKIVNTVDLFVYNAKIYIYTNAGNIDEALKVYMKIQDSGLEPNIVTWINLVRCYGKAGMIEGVKRIHSQLKYGVIEPNESLYLAVIDAYSRVNRHDLGELVKQEMKFEFGDSDNDRNFENENENENRVLYESDFEQGNEIV